VSLIGYLIEVRLFRCFTLALLALSAAANDTLATLRAGGLVPVKSSQVVMEHGELEVSVHQIAVRYRFRNNGDKDIDATVAFLLPELEGAAVEHGPLQLPSNGRPNFVDFEVLVAGQAIRPNLEVRAFQNGRDITGRLHAAGLAQRVRLGFPARSVLEVQHKYRPVVGGGVHHRHRHGRFGNQALLRRS
jgi:hypothetical protein